MIRVEDFVKVKITPEILSRSKSRAYNLGVLNNSITKGAGNLAGYMSEDVVRNYLGGTYSRGDKKYNHDIVVNNFKIEVKAKRRTVPPKISYEVSVAKTSLHQNPDYYVFTSVDDEFIWMVGFISLDEFLTLSREIKAGQVDKTNNFKSHVDMYNIYNYQLYAMKDLKNVLSTKNT